MSGILWARAVTAVILQVGELYKIRHISVQVSHKFEFKHSGVRTAQSMPEDTKINILKIKLLCTKSGNKYPQAALFSDVSLSLSKRLKQKATRWRGRLTLTQFFTH